MSLSCCDYSMLSGHGVSAYKSKYFGLMIKIWINFDVQKHPQKKIHSMEYQYLQDDYVQRPKMPAHQRRNTA